MPSHEIAIPALLGTNPLGALSAFGLLRVLNRRYDDVRLYFMLADDWVAVIQSQKLATLDEVIDACVDWIGHREIDEIAWSEDIRVDPKLFGQQLSELEPGSEKERFFAAFAAEGVEDKTKGLVKPGPLYMVSGQQSFFAGLRDIHSVLSQKPRELFEEALQGPWAYRSRVHHLGWDPAGERLHALRHRSPTSEKPQCIAGATWLAYEAMPLLTAFASSGRAAASGFVRVNRRYHFTWPLMTAAVSLEELRSLLQTRAYWNRDGRLRQGIAEVYTSERFEFGQGYGVFRPAKPWEREVK